MILGAKTTDITCGAHLRPGEVLQVLFENPHSIPISAKPTHTPLHPRTFQESVVSQLLVNPFRYFDFLFEFCFSNVRNRQFKSTTLRPTIQTHCNCLSSPTSVEPTQLHQRSSSRNEKNDYRKISNLETKNAVMTVVGG